LSIFISASKKKYRNYVFIPFLLVIGNEQYEINLNFCNNTFCKWYSLPQKKFEEVKNKQSRYKLQQTSGGVESEAEPRIMCNPVSGELSYRQSIENSSNTISNWSVAEEIKFFLYESYHLAYMLLIQYSLDGIA